MNLKSYVYIFVLILLHNSCKKEIEPQVSTGVLRFEYFGKDFFVNKSTNTQNQLYTILNNYQVSCLTGSEITEKWRYSADNYLIDLVPGLNDEVFAIGADYSLGYESVTITKLSPNGEVLNQSSPFEKLVPNVALHERLITAVPDGKNGLYMLVYLHDKRNPPQNETRYIVHLNDKNVIDKRVKTLGFEVYMQCDAKGNLFLIRTISPEGQQMTLQTIKVNMDHFNKNDNIIPEWQYIFRSKEPDWKWRDYFPFKFLENKGLLYIVKAQNTGVNDQCIGLDYIVLNSMDGNEKLSYSIPFGTSINHYRNRAIYYPYIQDGLNAIVYNFGFKSRYVEMNDLGTIINSYDLNGSSNRCESIGLSRVANKNVVFGISTMNKSLINIPFLYVTNSK